MSAPCSRSWWSQKSKSVTARSVLQKGTFLGEKKIIANSVLIGTLFTQQLVPDIPWSPVLNLFPFQLRPLCSAVKGGLTPKNPFSARVCQSKQPFPQPATSPEGQRDGSSIRTINQLITELPSHPFRQPSKCCTKSSIKITWVGHKNVTLLCFKSLEHN